MSLKPNVFVGDGIVRSSFEPALPYTVTVWTRVWYAEFSTYKVGPPCFPEAAARVGGGWAGGTVIVLSADPFALHALSIAAKTPRFVKLRKRFTMPDFRGVVETSAS
jgi:hypothetical protein